MIKLGAATGRRRKPPSKRRQGLRQAVGFSARSWQNSVDAMDRGWNLRPQQLLYAGRPAAPLRSLPVQMAGYVLAVLVALWAGSYRFSPPLPRCTHACCSLPISPLCTCTPIGRRVVAAPCGSPGSASSATLASYSPPSCGSAALSPATWHSSCWTRCGVSSTASDHASATVPSFAAQTSALGNVCHQSGRHGRSTGCSCIMGHQL